VWRYCTVSRWCVWGMLPDIQGYICNNISAVSLIKLQAAEERSMFACVECSTGDVQQRYILLTWATDCLSRSLVRSSFAPGTAAHVSFVFWSLVEQGVATSCVGHICSELHAVLYSVDSIQGGGNYLYQCWAPFDSVFGWLNTGRW
jgi:hypothetical protein